MKQGEVTVSVILKHVSANWCWEESHHDVHVPFEKHVYFICIWMIIPAKIVDLYIPVSDNLESGSRSYPALIIYLQCILIFWGCEGLYLMEVNVWSEAMLPSGVRLDSLQCRVVSFYDLNLNVRFSLFFVCLFVALSNIPAMCSCLQIIKSRALIYTIGIYYCNYCNYDAVEWRMCSGCWPCNIVLNVPLFYCQHVRA